MPQKDTVDIEVFFLRSPISRLLCADTGISLNRWGVIYWKITR